MLADLARRARAEARALVWRGLLSLIGAGLLFVALGLGLAAAVIETSTQIGVTAALGIWSAVTLLVATTALMMAGNARAGTGRVISRPAAPSGGGSRADGTPPTSVEDAFLLGERLGGSMSPTAVLGLTVLLGMLAGRSRH